MRALPRRCCVLGGIRRADLAQRRQRPRPLSARSDRASIASCSSPTWPARWCRSSILAVADRELLCDAADCDGAEERRQRTVTTAQRLVEDYAAIQQRGRRGARRARRSDHGAGVACYRRRREPVRAHAPAGHQRTRPVCVVSCSRRARPATSTRAILLDRAADLRRRRGDRRTSRYRLAAAPVRAGGRDGIVTVPLTNRQQEIEQQIDELDRRVLIRGGAVHPAGRGASATGWRSGSPIRSIG